MEESYAEAAARLLAGMDERAKKRASGRPEGPERIADSSMSPLEKRGRETSANRSAALKFPGQLAVARGEDGNGFEMGGGRAGLCSETSCFSFEAGDTARPDSGRAIGEDRAGDERSTLRKYRK